MQKGPAKPGLLNITKLRRHERQDHDPLMQALIYAFADSAFTRAVRRDTLREAVFL